VRTPRIFLGQHVTGALIVFCVTYLVIASRQLAILKLDRPGGALIGAVAMVVVGGMPMEAAFHAVQLDVIALLLGVLIIAAYLGEAKFFRRASWTVMTRSRSAHRLLWGIVFVSGAMSALLVNDTVCVVLTPLVLAVVVEAELPALPFLLALASGSNIGGAITFSGNPQNMIVGHAAAGHPSFAQYTALALPAGVACLAANALVIGWLFRKQLPTGPLAERAPPKPALDRVLAAKGLAALVAFAVMAVAGVALPGAALTAAAALMIAARIEPKRVVERIDWPLLLFFAGLFVVVGGLARTGAIASAFDHVAPIVARGDAAGDAAFVGLTVLGSNLVSNVPLVMIAVEWVPQMPDPAWGWVLLAFASTLAGNLTLFGSVANIIVMEGAGPRGEHGFWRFLRYGLPITLVSLVIGLAVLALERAIGYAALLGL
jgi:Na+/H+ antiporter NhaD/arsenite permease-like protein